MIMIHEVTDMAMSDNIKRFRKDAGLTQKSLAEKTGLSFSMISKLESGEQTNPSLETIRKIANVLSITPGELVNTPLSIEEQIDEYIEYKKGLSRGIAGSATGGAEENEITENPWIDLDFRRKFYGINEEELNEAMRLIETLRY
jgi:transcriptional regulator with XRE-family HTH domain